MTCLRSPPPELKIERVITWETLGTRVTCGTECQQAIKAGPQLSFHWEIDGRGTLEQAGTNLPNHHCAMAYPTESTVKTTGHIYRERWHDYSNAISELF